jgi:hypothetical protein
MSDIEIPSELVQQKLLNRIAELSARCALLEAANEVLSAKLNATQAPAPEPAPVASGT